jgi:soluble lytic murein transglycosylase-like protein
MKRSGPTLARPLPLAGICLPGGRPRPSPPPRALEIPAPGKISGADKRKLKPLIDETAKKYRLDKDLVHAVIAAESGHNPKAASRAGAIGLRKDKRIENPTAYVNEQ